MILVDEQALVLDQSNRVVSSALWNDGLVEFTVRTPSGVYRDMTTRLSAAETRWLWWYASDLVQRVPWMTTHDDDWKGGRLMIWQDDGIAWGRKLQVVEDFQIGTSNTSFGAQTELEKEVQTELKKAASARTEIMAGCLRSAMVEELRRSGGHQVTRESGPVKIRDSFVWLSDAGGMTTTNGVGLQTVLLDCDGTVLATFYTGSDVGRTVVLATRLPSAERDEVWTVATNMIASVDGDPPNIGSGGSCYGVGVVIKSETYWRKQRNRTDILDSIEIRDAVKVFRAAASNAFERMPRVDMKKMRTFADEQKQRLEEKSKTGKMGDE